MTDLADDAGPGDPRAGERLLRRATYLAVGVALLLAAVKAVAWFLTGSVSLLSSFIDSLLDAVASAVNLIAVREALRPATAAYRFGRGKLEPMAGLFQAAFISGSALLLFSEAIERLVEPEPIRAGGFGIAVMLFSIVATVALVWFQRHVVRRTKSLAISADSLHYTGDLLANSAVIIAILLTTQLGWHMADPIFGLGIAGYILYNAWRIAVRAFQMLLDRELDEADRDKIRAIAMSHPEVMALHDLRTRAAGPDVFIQFHLEMPPDLRLIRAHDIADRVEREILREFPNAEVIIHEDPAGIFEPHQSFLRDRRR